MDPFRDIHAIVTGGSSGIGLATVRRLAARGARVSVIALDDPYLAALRADPPPRTPLHLEAADVSQREQAEGAVAACVAALGPCDLLLTSAGIARPGYFQEIPDEVFDRHMAVNYFGTLYCIRAVVPAMLARRRGAIAAISSSAGLIPLFGYTAYGPSKYAVRGLTEILRIELRPLGIHVACVYPSDVDTPQLAGEEPYKPEELRRVAGTIKPIPPEQVADAILRGVARRRPVIYADSKTRWLARLAGMVPGFTRLYMNQSTRRARRHLPHSPA
jgi:3-dehydrosphinganine reductase